MSTKRIVLIIMCAMLVLTVVMAAIVIGKVSPLFGALMVNSDPVVPTEPSTQTEPTTETTTNPTTDPTTNTTTSPSTAPHEHAYVNVREQQEATCEATGYVIYACACGETKMETKEALGHSFGAGKLVAPKCEEEGYTLRKCSLCGKEEKQDLQDKLGHDWEFVKSVKVSCEVSGYDEYRCKRAGCTEVDHQNVVSATGHKWVKGDTYVPTCTEDGYTEYTCSNADCPVKTKQDDKIPALGHDFDDWKVTTDPVAGKPGEETRECKQENCKHKETRETELKIPMTNGQLKREDGKVWIYTINVAAKNAEGKEVIVYSYEVTDQSPFKDMTFTYDAETGLIIVFADKDGKERTYTLAPGNYSIIIDENGDKGTEPAPSEPSEPTTPTEPSEPTTPTEPSEPTTPTEPSEPTTPTEPGETTPSEPSEPTTPTESSEGTE